MEQFCSNDDPLKLYKQTRGSFIMSLVQRRSNGRPTKTEQLQIDDVLRPYFERNMSAKFTANSTGMNIKTVCIYFNRWAEEIINSKSEEHVRRWREERERTILSYDNLILEEYLRLDEINHKIKKLEEEGKEVPLNLQKSRQDVVKFISVLIEKKSRIALPPADKFSSSRGY